MAPARACSGPTRAAGQVLVCYAAREAREFFRALNHAGCGSGLWGAGPPAGSPMTGAAMALVIVVSWACVGDLFGVGDYGDLTDEGVFHGGVEEEVGDVCARG